ncbi:hypothetical protein CBR_g38841 [Chara braunii]|uniref:CCHC-type domain-containing protein n=1 Tax=Chara braunii TaxID=69332 RepID=A0A388LQM4_CHABU|nr:hypothetical protein CBR_g38841 [Chara braunii]|eukprot:GBG84559.1 hypothetical protein CBR_g38841 [Chara braunii]
MANNYNNNGNALFNRNCYNCGQPGHISRFCALPDKRLNGPGATSSAIVPYNHTANSGGSYGGQYAALSFLRQRVAELEDTVQKIKTKYEADEAKEKAELEEEAKKKREKKEEERREREKKDRETFHETIIKELSTKLDAVVGAIKKKSDESEVVKLKAEIERLKCAQSIVGPSTTIEKLSTEAEIFEKFRREQIAMKADSDRRFAILEEEIAKANRLRDEAVADAEA